MADWSGCTLYVAESVHPQHLLVKSAGSTRGRKQVNEVQRTPVATSSPARDRSSVIPSSPPRTGSQNSTEKSMSEAGGAPSRRELARLMGVDYQSKSRKTFLRNKVTEIFEKYIDMSKPFGDYDYQEEMYPVVKLVTKIMNRELGTNWTRTTTRYVISAIFEDTRRNAGSKPKQALIRKQKREGKAVSHPRIHVLLRS